MGLAVFLCWALVRSLVDDDRSTGGSIAHSLVRFAFVLVLFIATALPATFVLLRDGAPAARELVARQRYRRTVIAVYLVFPIAAAVVAFVVGHLLIVLVVLLALLLLFLLTGGF